jgi:hypothetical protein
LTQKKIFSNPQPLAPHNLMVLISDDGNRLMSVTAGDVGVPAEMRRQHQQL